MFLFIRLVLAHFIGDFPLQTNAVYKLKLRGLAGVIPHTLIIFGCGVALSWPFLRLPGVWAFLVFLSATHLVQDTLKLRIRTGKKSFWPYVIDQASHIGLIAMVFLTGLKDLPAPEPANRWVALYADDRLALTLIAYLAATYNGYYLIRCFKDSFLQRPTDNACEKWYGMAERALIITICSAGAGFMPLLALVALLRPLIFRTCARRFGLHSGFTALPDTALSWFVALAAAAGLSAALPLL